MKSFILTAALLLTNVIVMAQVTRSNQLSKKTDMNTNDKTASEKKFEKPDDETHSRTVCSNTTECNGTGIQE